MSKASKAAAIDAAVQMKRGLAMALRLTGASYGDIVKAGVYTSRSGARSAVMAALKENYTEPTEQVRAMEVARLEALISAHWSKAIGGDIASTKLCIEISARKCRILGIDAPMKVDIVGMLASLADPSGLNVDDMVSEAENLVNQFQQSGMA